MLNGKPAVSPGDPDARKETSPSDAPANLLSAKPRWIMGILRVVVRKRLRRWPGARIGELAEDDLVNEVMMALLDDDAAALRNFDPARGDATAYLSSFAKKRVIEAERKHLRRKELEEERREALPEPPKVTTPEDWYRRRELEDRLIRCLRACATDRELRLFYLAFVEGRSNQDIAQKMDASLPQVASWKFNVLKQARACLERLLLRIEGESS